MHLPVKSPPAHQSVNQETRYIKQISTLTLIHINNRPQLIPIRHKFLEVVVSEASHILHPVSLRVYHHPPLCRLHHVICQGDFPSVISAVVVGWRKMMTRWTKKKKTTTEAIIVPPKIPFHPCAVVVDSIWLVTH
jgi:hypothetical protein